MLCEFCLSVAGGRVNIYGLITMCKLLSFNLTVLS